MSACNNYKIYGISQNLDTKDYIIVFQDGYCVKLNVMENVYKLLMLMNFQLG